MVHTELLASVQRVLRTNSLRAFAAASGLSPSIISRFANEKSRCTMQSAEKMLKGVKALTPRVKPPTKKKRPAPTKTESRKGATTK